MRGRHRAGQPRGEPRDEPKFSAWRENIESFIWAVALALVIRTFIMAPFKIPSGSMRPTLMEGDRILVNKFIYQFRPPRRGEIIVFRYPQDPKRPFIKRLVASGGDTVELQDGKVVVNGESLEDTGVLGTTRYYNQGTFAMEHQAVRVPEGSFYVLGDNSLSSHDSRWWGFVPKRLVIGHAVCIFWPLKRIRLLR